MKKSRLLVIGNEYAATREIAERLRAADYQMAGVATMAEALAGQSTWGAAPDVIVVDVAPGSALDSLQVAEKLRAGLDIPVLFLAGTDDALLLQHAGIVAPSGYLLKPVQAREVRSAVEVALYRHNVEERLAEREASYRGLFEDAPFSVWEEDFSAVKAYLDELCAAGVEDLAHYLHTHLDVVRHCASLVKIVNVNPASVDLFGAQDKASLQQGLDKLFVDQSLTVFAEQLLAFYRWQKRFESEIVGRKFNGELVNTLCQATLVSGYEETWGKVFVMASDITARQRAEEALLQERRLLRAVVDHLPDAIYVKDLQGRKTLANRADLDNMGLATEEEALGKTDFDIFPFEVAAHFNVKDQQVFSTGQSQLNHEEFLCNRDGRCVWLLSSKLPLKDSAGQVVGLVGIGRDITERKRMELERELTIALLQLINEQNDLHDLACAVLDLLRRELDYEAVGIRLSQGDDFPYYETRGFPPEFVQVESSLCAFNQQGQLLRDSEGHPVLECMCGDILCGRFNPALPFFTEHGSFWATTTATLLAANSAADRQGRARNRCHAGGYQSTALIPLRVGTEILGLLQLNDRRPGRFDRQTVALLERLADSLATALAHRRAEEALRESEARYRGLADATTDAIYGHYVNADGLPGAIFEVNEVACRMLGYTRAELLQMHVSQVDAPDSGTDMPAVMRDLRAGRDVLFSQTHVTRDGRRLPVEVHARLATYKGKPAIFSTVRDITERLRAEEERQQAEAALRRSAATLRSIFRAASIGIGLVANRVILQVNDRICEMTGYTQDELVGQSARILYLTDEDFEYVGREKYRQIREYGTGTVETRWRHKDGQILDMWLSSTPLDPTDLAAGVTFTALDITERKRAEQDRERLLRQVQEQTRQMQQIMDTVPEGVLLLDAELRVLLCNPSALTYLPVLTSTPVWEPARILTQLGERPIAELLSPPPRGLWHDVSVKRQHFQVTARAIETGPMMGGWVLVIRDVTEEYAFRETVQRQDRLATVGQLAAGIAHDFNNILAGIVLYSQMSLRTPDLNPQLRDRLKIITDQAHRAADLINQILDFSRSTVLERLPLDLVPLLKEQVKLWERTLPESIQVAFTYGADAYTVNIDPTRMQQVFMNLVVNARDAMPEGGKLSIELARLHFSKAKQAPLPDMSPGDWVEIAVTDTGMGIPDDVLPYIYDPFFTTKPPGKGTGLGLSQVYGIVSSHDGYIDVKTQLGVGTTFTLYLPALALPEAPPAVVFDDLPMGCGETILVVEDNAAARAAIVASLELLNYRVLEAVNGRVALEVFAAHRAEIALVLTDLVMAEMGGKALAQALHQQAPALRVVVMTGHPLTDEREALQAVGVVAWLQKPPELARLAEVLAEGIYRSKFASG
ncbi:MAG TPA: PAS domain S-box protein [Anaerolineae bacterium]|nr:PAS domain S-box protein [Anaerolineae bacterium]HQI86580.1 PAS domain S-box protein [Anaerolineae bacterium]